MVAIVGQQPKEGVARGGACVGGLGRSGDEVHFWSWPEYSPENFSGGGWSKKVAAGGGCRMEREREDPIDYLADGGDDGDDEMDIEEDEDDDMDIDADEEDEDDEMDVKVDEEAKEEHPAPAYPVVVALPATAPPAKETEPFETDESAATPPPHPAYRMTARI
ncbi:hypothetical protein Tco_1193432, partial [Tanacetum coccineum]